MPLLENDPGPPRGRGRLSVAEARAWIFLHGYEDVDVRLVQLLNSRELDPAAFAEVLRDVWRVRPEVTSLTRETWLGLFRAAGFARDGVCGRRPRLPRRLYRGATEDNKEGLSWTLHLAIAADFARSRQGPRRQGQIWVGTFRPGRFLAYLDHEREFVVDARGAQIQPWSGEVPLRPRAVHLRAVRAWPMGS